MSGGDARSKVKTTNATVRNIFADPAKACFRQCQGLALVCAKLSGIDGRMVQWRCIWNADCYQCLKSVIAYLNGRYNSGEVRPFVMCALKIDCVWISPLYLIMRRCIYCACAWGNYIVSVWIHVNVLCMDVLFCVCGCMYSETTASISPSPPPLL